MFAYGFWRITTSFARGWSAQWVADGNVSFFANENKDYGEPRVGARASRSCWRFCRTTVSWRCQGLSHRLERQTSRLVAGLEQQVEKFLRLRPHADDRSAVYLGPLAKLCPTWDRVWRRSWAKSRNPRRRPSPRRRLAPAMADRRLAHRLAKVQRAGLQITDATPGKRAADCRLSLH
jgi:hypothetical protein